MAFSVPRYISNAGIITDIIEHDWNELEMMYLPVDSRLRNRIGGISYRGIIALSLGMAEWIIWRLSKFLKDPVPFQLIEALWAAIVDWHYLKWDNIPSWNEYPDPIRGPLVKTFNFLDQIVGLVRKKQFASPELLYISEIALHVIPDPKPFKYWRRFIIQNLNNVYPRKDEDILGPPVPRDFLELDFDYNAETARKVLFNYLKSLDHMQNPFLSSPEEMVLKGFTGTPYVL